MSVPHNKIYFTGYPTNLSLFTQEIEIFKRLGYEITYKCDELYPYADVNEKKEFTSLILQGVKKSDLIIVDQVIFHPDPKSWIAVGAALAMNKEIWFVGHKKGDESIYNLDNVSCFDSWFDVYSELHPID